MHREEGTGSAQGDAWANLTGSPTTDWMKMGWMLRAKYTPCNLFAYWTHYHEETLVNDKHFFLKANFVLALHIGPIITKKLL